MLKNMLMAKPPKIRVLYYNHVMYFEKVVCISLGTTVRLRQQDITSVAVVILCALANRGRHLCYLFFVRVLDGVFFSFFFSARWGVTAVQRLRRGPDKSRKSHSLVVIWPRHVILLKISSLPFFCRQASCKVSCSWQLMTWGLLSGRIGLGWSWGGAGMELGERCAGLSVGRNGAKLLLDGMRQ